MRIFALKRSGQHAFVRWVAQQSIGPVRFINSCRAFLDPCEHHGKQPKTSRDPWCIPLSAPEFTTSSHVPLVYNYENFDFRELGARALERPDIPLVPGARFRDVILLRDPFNLFASHRQWRPGDFEDDRYIGELADLWKVHARETLRTTRYLADPVCVSYNAWFSDPSYRLEVIQALELPVAEDGGIPSQVPRFGGGSSFDGLTFDGRASDMRVLERWKEHRDERRLQAFLDAEVRELAARIFGQLEA
jgi:hypothetical protein